MLSNCLWQRQGHYSNWKISSTRIIPTKTTTTYQIAGKLSNNGSSRHVQKFVLGGKFRADEDTDHLMLTPVMNFLGNKCRKYLR